jgi:ATP:cob(I)alamin adenosyltransferase
MFTRRGDKGETDLPKKGRVGKDSLIVEFLGNLDELNSTIGYTITLIPWKDFVNDLEEVQIDLFTIGEDVAANSRARVLEKERISWLESRTLKYKEEAGPIKLFVVPGGSKESGLLHIARAIARRVERVLVSLSREEEVNLNCLIYMNRLSSLLFVMAVLANRRQGIEDKIWELRGREL